MKPECRGLGMAQAIRRYTPLVAASLMAACSSATPPLPLRPAQAHLVALLDSACVASEATKNPLMAEQIERDVKAAQLRVLPRVVPWIGVLRGISRTSPSDSIRIVVAFGRHHLTASLAPRHPAVSSLARLQIGAVVVVEASAVSPLWLIPRASRGVPVTSGPLSLLASPQGPPSAMCEVTFRAGRLFAIRAPTVSAADSASQGRH